MYIASRRSGDSSHVADHSSPISDHIIKGTSESCGRVRSCVLLLTAETAVLQRQHLMHPTHDSTRHQPDMLPDQSVRPLLEPNGRCLARTRHVHVGLDVPQCIPLPHQLHTPISQTLETADARGTWPMKFVGRSMSPAIIHPSCKRQAPHFQIQCTL